MQPIKHILVAVDFERASKAGMEHAIVLARALGARLTLLHVWEIPIYPYMDFMLNSELIARVEDSATKRLQEELDDARALAPDAESELKSGLAWQGILDAAQELRADLIVLGTHGRQGMTHAMLGSVAEKVVRLSAVPVLTVHAPASA
jgi:nucleotide-binding universal stress UspA family protein